MCFELTKFNLIKDVKALQKSQHDNVKKEFNKIMKT